MLTRAIHKSVGNPVACVVFHQQQQKSYTTADEQKHYTTLATTDIQTLCTCL